MHDTSDVTGMSLCIDMLYEIVLDAGTTTA